MIKGLLRDKKQKPGWMAAGLFCLYFKHSCFGEIVGQRSEPHGTNRAAIHVLLRTYIGAVDGVLILKVIGGCPAASV
jgi:hypothetical protein